VVIIGGGCAAARGLSIKKAAGYRMPAEWEPHLATWLAWPNDLETWPKELPQVEAIYDQMVEALHQEEQVHVLVNDRPIEERVSKRLRRIGVKKNVFFHQIAATGVWIRDYGPTFVVSKEPLPASPAESARGKRMVHWKFNAWGGKYDSHRKDGDVPRKLAKLLGMKRDRSDVVLEGGSIEVNGAGTCLTTEQCLLNQNRNPRLKREEIEQYLEHYLGVSRVIWLKQGIVGDDTDGHVDTVARFAAPRTVVVQRETDRNDANFKRLLENWRRLERAVDQNGVSLNLIPVPMPKPIHSGRTRLPASYANFYIGNRIVLVPAFGDKKNDARAIEILRSLFPSRKVIGIPCRPLLLGLGGIHCVTQQEPAV
jgi:agmatine deiminase